MKDLLTVAGLLTLMFVLVVIYPFLTMWAWSHSVSSVFGFPELTWVQAFAFGILGRIFCASSNYRSQK